MLTVAGAGPVRGQNPDMMDPDQNTAKAKQILKQLIDAMGGPIYLNAKSLECDGRRAMFGHNGQMMGYVDFKDYRVFPDNCRVFLHGKKALL